MPIYQYRAKNLSGDELNGEYEAVSNEALEYMLREKGYFLIASNRKGKDIGGFALFGGRVSHKELAVFSRQFSVLINAGVTIVEAIGILQEQVENRRLREVLADIHEDMQKGRVLSEAMGAFPEIFPDFMMSMIQVGEASGSLDLILNRLADYYENDAKIRRKVKAAMSYPILLIILTIGVVTLLMVKIIPMFSDILGQLGGQLPLITRILVAVSTFMANNFFVLLIIICGIVFGFSYWKKTDTGRLKFDAFKLQVPLINTMIKKSITARFARSLSILLKSGISVINAMEIIKDLIGNRAVELHFISCVDEIRQGKGIAQPLLKLGIFPPLLIHMVSVGESTGELDEMLSRTAGFFDEEVEEAIGRMTMLIEPILIIFMALVVGSVILSIMLPMISVLSAVQ